MMSKVNNIAHRLVPLCLLLVALAGCRKEDTPAPDTPSGTPIAFTPETATKAAVSGVEDIQNDPNGFRVWSWFQGTTSGPMFGADGTPVTYDTATSAWTYEPTRYWMNGIYDFAAIYPAAITTGEGEAATTTAIAGTYAPATAGGAPVLTVPNFDATTQADLLVAFNNGTDGTGINGATPPSVVNLNFKHALTKINIRIEQDLSEDEENHYFIKRVALSGIKVNGTYTASLNNAVLNGSWDIATSRVSSFYKTFEGDGEQLKQIDENGKIVIDENGNPIANPIKVWGEDGLLLIPQEVGTDAMQVLIEYNYQLDGSDIKTSRSITTYLPASTDLWQSGKAITYVIPIAEPSDIIFAKPTIEPWGGEPQTGDTIII